MGGFPFLLAHIELIVAGGAAPVDTPRGLAGKEVAVLPEILARSGPPAAVQPVDDGRRDAACLKDETRHGFRERAGLAAGALSSLDLVPRRSSWCRHQINRRAS
jgi:hypothetical protein